MRMNGLRSHSAPIVDGSVCPGWMRVSGGQRHQPLHDRVVLVRVAGRPAAAVPPTVPLKRQSAVKQSRPSTSSARWPGQWPGVAIARISRPRTGPTSPSPIVWSIRTPARPSPTADRRHAEAPGEPGDIDDVVAVLVRDEDVGDRQPRAVTCSSSGLRRRSSRPAPRARRPRPRPDTRSTSRWDARLARRSRAESYGCPVRAS